MTVLFLLLLFAIGCGPPMAVLLVLKVMRRRPSWGRVVALVAMSLLCAVYAMLLWDPPIAGLRIGPIKTLANIGLEWPVYGLYAGLGSIAANEARLRLKWQGWQGVAYAVALLLITVHFMLTPMMPEQ